MILAHDKILYGRAREDFRRLVENFKRQGMQQVEDKRPEHPQASPPPEAPRQEKQSKTAALRSC